jgi:hypothetical protein
VSGRPDPTIDPKRGTVYVWAKDSVLSEPLHHCLRRDTRIDIRNLKGLTVTARLDFYIVTSLSASAEWEALRHHAVPVALPAASVWLASEIDRITAQGENVSIAYRKPHE